LVDAVPAVELEMIEQRLRSTFGRDDLADADRHVLAAAVEVVMRASRGRSGAELVDELRRRARRARHRVHEVALESDERERPSSRLTAAEELRYELEEPDAG
jgi:hypothetical protein